jgi:putative Holliday junction resolvase
MSASNPSRNLVSIEDMASLHTRGARLLGLDLGTKTIGIAVSDGTLSIGSGLETIQRTKFSKDVARLNEICGANQVFGLVMGFPLNMDGSEGPRAQATRAFVRNLANLSDLPVVLWDERLSTVAAERAMIEADMSRKKRAEKIDATAAAFILQGALDRLRTVRSRDNHP